ncbi:MAG: alpha/beta hydrolase [Desulfobacterota bacterium]|nr:alpha/beta hydrolase [Thermodesulfobacteriota bacterium]
MMDRVSAYKNRRCRYGPAASAVLWGVFVLSAVVGLYCCGDAAALRSLRSVGPDGVSIEDIPAHAADGTPPLRLYRPPVRTIVPIILYYHGGGWVYGGLETHTTLCTYFAATVPALVVAVEYRLAPQHKFPAAVEDAYAALVWASRHAAAYGADPERIAVCGDSAGGNLAAAVCLMARDRHGPSIAVQVLVFPVTDLTSLDTESYRLYGKGSGLTRRQMAWFREQYLKGKADRNHPYASPLRAERLSGLPPALVITGEEDVLRDEGEAYARRLIQEGGTVSTLRLLGEGHAVNAWGAVSPRMQPAYDAAVATFRRAFVK